MFKATLLQRYPIVSNSIFLGQPAGRGGVGKYFSAAEVMLERPLTKIRRGSDDFRRRGMNWWVRTFVPATLTSYDLAKHSRRDTLPRRYSMSKVDPERR